MSSWSSRGAIRTAREKRGRRFFNGDITRSELKKGVERVMNKQMCLKLEGGDVDENHSPQQGSSAY